MRAPSTFKNKNISVNYPHLIEAEIIIPYIPLLFISISQIVFLNCSHKGILNPINKLTTGLWNSEN